MQKNAQLFLTLCFGFLGIFYPCLAQDEIIVDIKNKYYDARTQLDGLVLYDNDKEKEFTTVIPGKPSLNEISTCQLSIPSGNVRQISLLLTAYHEPYHDISTATLIDNQQVLLDNSALQTLNITISYCKMNLEFIYKQ